MTTIKILNIEPSNYSPIARNILLSLGDLTETPLNCQELLECIGDFDVLITRLGSQIDKEILDAAKCLKFILTATTGLDHIDLGYAELKGIRVLSLKGETEFLHKIPATAEHTWGLLLSLTRKIPQAVFSVHSGEWDRDRFRGHDLLGKRLGIVGLGRIGEKVALYGQAFGMHVSAYDPYKEIWPNDATKQRSLKDLLVNSDVISLHVPLSPETEDMIGMNELKLMNRGALLVNTSRGEVIVEEDLVQALESGHIAGAALDVIRNERLSEARNNGTVLRYASRRDNLLITPHIGGATRESMAMTEIFMAEKLARVIRSA